MKEEKLQTTTNKRVCLIEPEKGLLQRHKRNQKEQRKLLLVEFKWN